MASVRHVGVIFALLAIVLSLIGCKNTDRSDATIFGVPVVANVLSYGVDATKIDLWTLRDIYYTSIFENMPEECNIAISCPRSELKESKKFETTKEFTETFTSSFGIDIGADWKGLGANLHVGTDGKSSSSHSTQQKSSWWKLSRIGKCGQLKMSCVANASYFSPSARAVLEDLEEEDKILGGQDDAETLQRWYERFIRPFGSHIVKAVSHGAALQALHTLDKSCKAGDICEGVSVGLTFGFVSSTFEEFDADVNAKIDLNHRNEECEESNACITDAKTKCAALGGSGGSLELCGSDVTGDQVSEFMTSGGSFDDSSSVISMQLMPMQSVLAFQGYPAEVQKKIEQTVEFITCEKPLGTWTPRGQAGGHFCKCTLTCKNGGVLDEESCTCKCKGHDFHGWKGRDCSESYGKCKCGKALGMGVMEKRCCKGGNACGSVSGGEKICEDTEICCNRLEGAHCCPLGTSCGKFKGIGKNPIFDCVPN